MGTTFLEGVFEGFRAVLATAVIAAFVSYLATPFVRKLAIERGAVDDPKQDERRIHKEPTPRWGGLAIYAGLVVSLLAILPFAFPGGKPFPNYLIGILLVGGAVVVMGALDDLYTFKARTQMLFLLGAGVAVQFFESPVGKVQIQTVGVPLTDSMYVTLGAFAIPVTAAYIFVVTKTMDTIDGVDGLAAGIATITATTLAIIAHYGEMPRVAIVAAAVAGASLGFLKHNYNPARIFMGTGGAQLLGFILACLSIVGALKTAAAVALLVPILVFGVPIFDAFFVIVRRLIHGQPITQADTRHIHHTLLGRGLSARQTVWVMYAMAAALGALAIFMIRHNG